MYSVQHARVARRSPERGLTLAGPVDQAVHEGAAAFELGDLDELVGLVGLVDGARAADDGGEPRALELARLGGEGDDARRAVVSGETPGERLGDAARLRREGRHVGA